MRRPHTLGLLPSNRGLPEARLFNGRSKKLYTEKRIFRGIYLDDYDDCYKHVGQRGRGLKMAEEDADWSPVSGGHGPHGYGIVCAKGCLCTWNNLCK